MKLTSLFIFILVIFRAFCINFHEKFLQNQRECENLVEILGNVTTQNAEIQNGIVKIEISFYKTTLDMNCILSGLQEVNKNITISSISRTKIIAPRVAPDYLIYSEDFMKDPSMNVRGVLHSLKMKTSTKFIIITRFDNDMEYKAADIKHSIRIRKFLKFPTYTNALILDVVGNKTKIRRYLKTLNSELELSNVNDPYNFNMVNYMENLKTIFDDNPPFSHRDSNNRIIGVEGNLIEEFCKQQKLDYEIVNRDYNHLTAIVPDVKFDFSLYRRINGGSRVTTDTVLLNDIGASHCALVPRNIPVYVPFSSPYSKIVNILFFLSIFVVMVVWKVIKRLQRQKLTVIDSGLEALKVILGLGIDDSHWMRWSLKEKILLAPFLLMFVILMDIYESHIVSTVISEHEMRSVKSIEELVKSDTIIYEYYRELNRFDTDKVFNLLPFSRVTLSTIPEKFDPNFAYFVSCRFGEEFMNSEENFIGDRRLFDMITDDYLDPFLSTYLINENFPLKAQFKLMVKSLDEAGIIDYWTKDVVKLHFPQHKENDDQKPILLSAMIVPIFIVVIGLAISSIIFGFEFPIHKLCSRKSNRVGDIELEMIRVGNNVKITVNLDKNRRRHSV